MMRKISGIVLAICLLFSVPGAAYADNISQIIGDGNIVIFTDVSDNYWAKSDISYFASQGIVSGVGNNRFQPEEGVTREQFTKMLVLTFQAPLSTPNEPTFSDVSPNAWSYPYVETCKEFLTGYTNPFGGKPAFHAEEHATREDIAVALVRMMGLTDADVKDANYASRKFSDAGSISPDLLKYVSLAAERGLISGYPNGTFGPTRGITRAETVVLLNRATKSAVTNINADLELSANVLYSQDGKTATINIKSEEGTKVTVDGQSVHMSQNYSGQYEGNHVYKFEAEGSKNFTVEAVKGGKTRSVQVTAKYETGAPALTLDQITTTVTDKNFKLSGKVTDANSSTSVKINGVGVSVDSYFKTFSSTFTLKEGENTFTVVATNQSGKQTTKSITVTYSVGAPALTLDQVSTTVNDKSFKLSGKVTDANYSVNVKINGAGVQVDSYFKTFSNTYTLNEGENTFTVVATNENGKQTTKSITVTYSVGAPTLTLDQSSTSVTDKSFKLSGKATDANYSVNVKINGAGVQVDSYFKTFSKTFTLSEGENTFTVVATNENGKQTTKSITVTYSVGAPTLTLDQVSTSVTDRSFKLSGKATDDNYAVNVKINGAGISVDSYFNTFSKTFTLDEGENMFTVVATNDVGKSTTKTISITLEFGEPKITFINCPTTTSQQDLSIIGRVGGASDGVRVFINDQSVSVGYDKEFTKRVVLDEGENTFTFRAVNSYGKEVTVTKTIEYTP